MVHGIWGQRGSGLAGSTVPFWLLLHFLNLRQTTHTAFHSDLSSRQSVYSLSLLRMSRIMTSFSILHNIKLGSYNARAVMFTCSLFYKSTYSESFVMTAIFKDMIQAHQNKKTIQIGMCAEICCFPTSHHLVIFTKWFYLKTVWQTILEYRMILNEFARYRMVSTRTIPKLKSCITQR